MRQQIRPTRYRLAAFATAVLASVATVGLLPGVARADLPAGKTFDLAAGGSDTTTPVLDAIAAIVTPGHIGTDTNVFDSFDATGTATVTTTDAISNALGLTCTNQARPNGSGQGLKALAGSLAGTTLGCFQFARVSRPPQTGDTTNVTWIPFGQDIVDFVVTNTSNLPRTLTLAELQSIYQCQSTYDGTAGGGGPALGGWNFNPVIPQSGSGTRLFWESIMGISDPSAFNAANGLTTTPASLGCLIDGVNPAQTSQIWEEHTATLENDNEVAPFSIAQYEIQAEGLITDQRGRAVLGDIQTGSAIWQPQTLNAPGSQTGVAAPSTFEREIFNAVPTVSAAGTPACVNTTAPCTTASSASGTTVTLQVNPTGGPGSTAGTYGFVTGGSVTVTGGTGGWASVNGTWTLTNVTGGALTFNVTTAPTGSINSGVVANSQLSTEIQNVFVGAGSDLCAAGAFGGAVQSTLLEFHVLADIPGNCGTLEYHT